MRYALAVAALATVLSVRAEDHLILVGDAGTLTFKPSNITAAQGDTVIFQFQTKNHTVTQSTFGKPCELMTTPKEGINSGFQFVDPAATTVAQWSFTVDDPTAALWFFCAQTNPVSHCNKGMVFSVNSKEDTDKNFAAYQALAMSSTTTGGSPSGGGASQSGGASGGASQSGNAQQTGGAGSNGGSPGGSNGGSPGGASGGASDLTNSGTPTDSAGNALSTTGAGTRLSVRSASVLAVVGLVAGLML